MKNKSAFWKNLSIALVVAAMGLLLIGCYFIPVIGPSDTYKNSEKDKSYSCYDIIVAMNATSIDDLSDEQIEALYATSKNEGKAGQLVRVVGVMGMINAMIGASIFVCALAMIFLKYNIFRTAAMGFSIAAFCVSIAMLALICSYLGIMTEAAHPYSFYYAIHASTFVMLGASMFSGASSWFLGYFDGKKAKQE